MFQNAAIDVAIALSLMYLMLSLFCTVINEYIATKLKLRAKALASGLKTFLDDPATLRRRFLNNVEVRQRRGCDRHQPNANHQSLHVSLLVGRTQPANEF